MRYIEIIDEEITDLFGNPHSKYGDALTVVYHEWEGPTVTNASWVTVKNAAELSDVFRQGKMRRNT